MMDIMITEEVFLKTVDAEGNTTYTSHWVWDPVLWLGTRVHEAAEDNFRKKSRKASATRITRQQYLEARHGARHPG